MKNVKKMQSYMPYKCWKDVWFLWSLTEEPTSPKLSVPKAISPRLHLLYILMMIHVCC